ncbi:MAG: transposase [Tateyamaria sp.]|nr:transposase [Tateyamaria sp.]MDG1334767.1 transposase [Tateyamaria sp.]
MILQGIEASVFLAISAIRVGVTMRPPRVRRCPSGFYAEVFDWYFGMKAHVGVDAENGIVHSLEATTAKTHDSHVWDELLHGKETSVWADKGYVHAGRETAFTKKSDAFWGVMRKAPKGGELDELDAQINQIIAKVRSKVEHPFPILKRQFGHRQNTFEVRGRTSVIRFVQQSSANTKHPPKEGES